eukprot:scaffold41375_cov33-Tisochrysis_lutea.AAC.2
MAGRNTHGRPRVASCWTRTTSASALTSTPHPTTDHTEEAERERVRGSQNRIALGRPPPTQFRTQNARDPLVYTTS